MSSSNRTQLAAERRVGRQTLDLITATGAGLGAVMRRSSTTLVFDLLLARPDGKVTPFNLVITANGRFAQVRESKPQLLPAGCPNRHINFDGGFCFNWQAGEPLPINDEAAAMRWWSLLQQFLRLQAAAGRLRRWPGDQWAHGDAARHQARAEIAAASLGAGFDEDLRRSRLRVTRARKGFIQLLRCGRRLYAVWVSDRRVATLRQACVCGSGRTLRSCHREQTAELALALADWKHAETRFWESMKDHACCGTLNDCPLRRPTSEATNPERLAA